MSTDLEEEVNNILQRHGVSQECIDEIRNSFAARRAREHASTESDRSLCVMYNSPTQRQLVEPALIKHLSNAKREYTLYDPSLGHVGTILYVLFLTTPRLDQQVVIPRFESARQRCDKIIILACRKGRSVRPLLTNLHLNTQVIELIYFDNEPLHNEINTQSAQILSQLQERVQSQLIVRF